MFMFVLVILIGAAAMAFPIIQTLLVSRRVCDFSSLEIARDWHVGRHDCNGDREAALRALKEVVDQTNRDYDSAAVRAGH